MQPEESLFDVTDASESHAVGLPPTADSELLVGLREDLLRRKKLQARDRLRDHVFLNLNQVGIR